jgi:hypothetical protein
MLVLFLLTRFARIFLYKVHVFFLSITDGLQGEKFAGLMAETAVWGTMISLQKNVLPSQ